MLRKLKEHESFVMGFKNNYASGECVFLRYFKNNKGGQSLEYINEQGTISATELKNIDWLERI